MPSVLNLKKSNCKNCHRCIRKCPVKSIRFSGHQNTAQQHGGHRGEHQRAVRCLPHQTLVAKHKMKPPVWISQPNFPRLRRGILPADNKMKTTCYFCYRLENWPYYTPLTHFCQVFRERKVLCPPLRQNSWIFAMENIYKSDAKGNKK